MKSSRWLGEICLSTDEIQSKIGRNHPFRVVVVSLRDDLIDLGAPRERCVFLTRRAPK